MVLIILIAIIYIIVGLYLSFVSGALFYETFDKGALWAMLIGLSFLLIGSSFFVIISVKAFRKFKSAKEQKNKRKRQQELKLKIGREHNNKLFRNNLKKLKSWEPANWVDDTKNIYKVPASLVGSYNRNDNRWNPQDMQLTVTFKDENYSKLIDFDTSMEIYEDKGGKYHCSLQEKDGKVDLTYLYYKNSWYFSKAKIAPKDMVALINATERRKKEKSQPENESARLKDENSHLVLRDRIPEEIKEFVWKRDGGKCVRCGSNINLEYGHKIPLSKGGSDSSRNLQLLCESCNLANRVKIGG